jgi:hypothetical protein
MANKATRLRPAPDDSAEAPEPTWTDAHELLDVEITAIDRLDVFAGDGEEGPEAPQSVRIDPELLLPWCQRYEPQSVLDDKAALVNARNRTMAAVVYEIRCRDPKLRVTPAHVIAHLETERRP